MTREVEPGRGFDQEVRQRVAPRPKSSHADRVRPALTSARGEVYPRHGPMPRGRRFADARIPDRRPMSAALVSRHIWRRRGRRARRPAYGAQSVPARASIGRDSWRQLPHVGESAQDRCRHRMLAGRQRALGRGAGLAWLRAARTYLRRLACDGRSGATASSGPPRRGRLEIESLAMGSYAFEISLGVECRHAPVPADVTPADRRGRPRRLPRTRPALTSPWHCLRCRLSP